MVKFGRHVDFFVANELDSARQLYVVPYKDVQHKTCIENPHSADKAAVLVADHNNNNLPPPPSPSVVASNAPVWSTSPRYESGANSTPQHAVVAQHHHQQQRQDKPAASASALSALFDNPTSSPNNNNNAIIGDKVCDLDLIANSPNIRPKISATSAVTLNAGTGAELAAAVKGLLIAQRGGTIPGPKVGTMIPDDYGYDDPCNHDNDHGSGDGEEEDDADIDIDRELRTIMSEDEREAQAHFFASRFRTEWRICLKRASADFDRAMQLFWSEVFGGISSYKETLDSTNEEEKEQIHEFEESMRGALPDAALQMYVASVQPERAQETFSFLKNIHATALINAEALRKLVKKFDKMHYKLDRPRSYLLSAKLLPEVYASNFTGSLASLEAGLALLRVLLNIEDDDNGSLPGDEGEKETPKAIRDEKRRLRKLATVDDELRDSAVLSGGYFGNKQDIDAEQVKRRKEELIWLRNLTEGIDRAYIPLLVAHRGFHSIHDRSDVRPLENSLMAYEAAWTNGVHLCECDIALTKDERIILAHDENFARLGMDPTSPLCNRTVRDLTFKELMNCPLKSGARPPLLFDVLRSAAAIGGDAKMIVEIKAGNTEAGPALAKMFVRHPSLMEHVAVVMSFDAFIMHNLRREMAAVFEQLHSSQQQQQQLIAPAAGAAHQQGHARSSTPVIIPMNNTQEAVHPLKGPILSRIALGSCLSSSPNMGPSMMSQHHRAPSHSRVPSTIGAHNRLDSRDMFGMGYQAESRGDMGLGLNLGDTDATMSSSQTFLPIPVHKSVTNLHKQPSHHEEENEEEKKESSHYPPNNTCVPNVSFPKLLLITVAETPKADYELFLDVTKPESGPKLDHWLRGGDGGMLDGVYMQYQKAMMGPEGSKAMRNLAARYDLGIWGANPIPDDWGTFHSLVSECHVSYVNSSLPKHFRRKMKRSISANTLAMNGILANHSHDAL